MKEFLYIFIFAFVYVLALVLILNGEDTKSVTPPYITAADSIAEKDSIVKAKPMVVEKKNPVEIVDSIVPVTHADIVGRDTISITITYYQPTTAQCGSNPLVTADGSRIDLSRLERGELRWCAVSPDLYVKGGKIWIDGMGVYEIHDKTSSRHRAWVDILISPNHKPKATKRGHRAVIF